MASSRINCYYGASVPRSVPNIYLSYVFCSFSSYSAAIIELFSSWSISTSGFASWLLRTGWLLLSSETGRPSWRFWRSRLCLMYLSCLAWASYCTLSVSLSASTRTARITFRRKKEPMTMRQTENRTAIQDIFESIKLYMILVQPSSVII